MNKNIFQYWSKNILTIVCLLLSQYSYAQLSNSLSFDYIDKTKGLPSNFIKDIKMDSLGFLWIATYDGLCRYDSPNNIKVYTEGQIGLESSLINTIHIGSNNNLWIGTNFGGLTRYNILDNSSRTYNQRKEDKHRLANNEVLAVNEINPTEVWVGTEKGLDILFPETDSVYHLDLKDRAQQKIPATAVTGIFTDDRDWVWLSTWNGGFCLYLPDPEGRHDKGIFRKFHIDGTVGTQHTWKVFQDSNGIYWIATQSGGLYAMQLPKGASNHPEKQNWSPSFLKFINDGNNLKSISNDYIQDIGEDNEGNIWVASSHGLNILTPKEQKKLDWSNPNSTKNIAFYQYHHSLDKQNSLLSSNVSSIYKDKQGLIWLGSISGVNQFNWYTNQFQQRKIPNIDDKFPEKYNRINGIVIKDSSNLILASSTSGLISYDLVKDKPNYDDSFDSPYFNQRITTLYKYDDETVYAGALIGVEKIDLRTNKSKLFKLSDLELGQAPNIYIRSILKDRKGRLWSGTESGLFLIKEEYGSFVKYLRDGKNPESISDNSVTQVLEDSKGNIWFSTYNGLNVLQESNTNITFKSFKKEDKGFEKIIPTNQITAMTEYGNRVYFGTNKGVFCYDLNADDFSFQSFGLIDEEPLKQTIYSMQVLEGGIMWLSTSDGLLRFNLSTKEHKLYGKNDGIGSMSLRSSIGSVVLDDKLFFSTNEGFFQIKDSQLKRNNIVPKVYITDVKTVNSDSQESTNCINRESITIPHNNHYVAIDFSALNYNQAERNQYEYRLENFQDDSWRSATKQQVEYTNLEAGEYVFRVRASNNEGIWNNEGAKLNITVKPAFIETIAFKLLMGILGALLIFGINNLYNRNIRQRNELLNAQINKTEAANRTLEEREKHMKVLLGELDESNKELLRSNEDLEQFAYITAHDLQGPLTTIGSFAKLLDKRYGEKLDDDGKQYIDYIDVSVSRMSKLMNDVMKYTVVGNKNIKFAQADLNEVAKECISDLSTIIEQKNAKIVCQELPTLYCSGNQIGMVFYSLILNGIKFNKSKQPEIAISAKELESHWEFQVKDNGIGISEQYQKQIFGIFKRLHKQKEYDGTGIGLSLCNKIVDRHNGVITIASEEDQGSTFSFTISKKLEQTEKLEQIKRENLASKKV